MASRASGQPRLRLFSTADRVLAWGVFALGLAVTGWVTSGFVEKARSDAARSFEAEASQVQDRLSETLKIDAMALRSGAALFAARPDVTRQEWRSFVSGLHVEDYLPGVQGIGYARYVRSSQLGAHEEGVRGEGFADYRVSPPGNRAAYSPIVFLEPFAGRNLRAFGYDMYSETVRREAMDRATDGGAAALSGRVTLVQEDGTDLQAGTLLFVPVYHTGSEHASASQRRAALVGWVFSPFRMDDLVRPTLASVPPWLDLRLYDGRNTHTDNLLFDSLSSSDRLATLSEATFTLELATAGRVWTLAFHRPGGPAGGADFTAAWVAGLGALVMTLLLVGLIHTLQSTRYRAQRMARNLALRETSLRMASRDGLHLLDDTGQVVEVNQAFCDMLGYTRDELLAMRVADWDAQWSAVALPEVIADRIRTPGLFQTRHRRKDGSLYDAEINAVAVKLDGRTYLYAAARDVTQRNAAEARLREVLDNARDAAYKRRLPGDRFEYLSPAIESILGFAMEQMIDLPEERILEPVHPDDAPQVRSVLELASRSAPGATFNLLFRLRHRDGSWRWIADRFLVVADTEGLARIGTLRDVSDNQATLEQLKQAEERSRLIVETLTEGVALNELVYDEAGVAIDYRILETNQAFLTQADYRRGVPVAGSLASELYGMPKATVTAFWQAHLGATENAITEMVSPLHGRMFRIATSPFRGDRFVTSFLDVTETRRLEAEARLFEAQGRQREKGESLGRMAGAIAHQFNNHLQVLATNLDLLERQSSSAQALRSLSMARRAAERASEVTRLMLHSLGQASPVLQSVHLTELCRDSVRDLAKALPKSVVVDVYAPDPGPTVQADADQVFEMLSRLVDNAVEALGKEGGRITVMLRSCESEEVPSSGRFPVGWSPGGNLVEVRVSDSGAGLDAHALEKVFDPFYSTKGLSRGMGLPVVLGLIQAHGGGMSVESRVGEGTAFSVYFPLAERGVIEQSPPAPVRQGRTLLLVDDDRDLRESTAELLVALGYPVLTAGDGVEAVAIFESHRDEIACVITDLTMPRMDGWDTLEALRGLDPNVPVILASGFDKAQVLAGGRQHKPQAVLAKPFDVRGLREALTAALGPS